MAVGGVFDLEGYDSGVLDYRFLNRRLIHRRHKIATQLPTQLPAQLPTKLTRTIHLFNFIRAFYPRERPQFINLRLQLLDLQTLDLVVHF